jgi:hypothetical protein
VSNWMWRATPRTSTYPIHSYFGAPAIRTRRRVGSDAAASIHRPDATVGMRRTGVGRRSRCGFIGAPTLRTNGVSPSGSHWEAFGSNAATRAECYRSLADAGS